MVKGVLDSMLWERYIQTLEQKALDYERLQKNNSNMQNQLKDVEGGINKVNTLKCQVDVFKCLYIDTFEKLNFARI